MSNDKDLKDLKSKLEETKKSSEDKDLKDLKSKLEETKKSSEDKDLKDLKSKLEETKKSSKDKDLKDLKPKLEETKKSSKDEKVLETKSSSSKNKNSFKKGSKSKNKDLVLKEKEEKKLEEKKSAEFAGKSDSDEEVLKISALLAEMIGTFILAGAVIKLGSVQNVGSFAIAFILVLLVMILGPISGAHLNPAVTLALLFNKKISGIKSISYIFSQLIGAALALLLFKYLFDNSLLSALIAGNVTVKEINAAGGAYSYLETLVTQFQASGYSYTIDSLLSQFGLTSLPDVTIAKGVELYTAVVELLAAIVFGLGVGHAVFKEDKSMWETGFSVGFGLFSAIAIFGSTAVLNPAVGLAVGAFELTGSNMWAGYLIYIVVTTIGMYLGVTAYRFLFSKSLEN
ncbi:MAG: aquaporin [Lactovum sp.]